MIRRRILAFILTGLLGTGQLLGPASVVAEAQSPAPQSPAPQPNFVPVRPSVSRRTQRRGVSPGTSTTRDRPFTTREKDMGSGSGVGVGREERRTLRILPPGGGSLRSRACPPTAATRSSARGLQSTCRNAVTASRARS